ncbi:MAG: dual specificity protein phosphatase family protein [Chloroflexi bacterium]|nr:dual specificity protein phosphatase family protein [Chloroflexota bacterium]
MHTITNWLAIGRLSDINNELLLQGHKIKAILVLGRESASHNLPAMALDVQGDQPISSDVLGEALSFIHEQKAQGNKVLITCDTEISLSTAYATAALKEETGMSVLDSFLEVRKYHPSALPNPVLWQSLAEIYGEPMAFEELQDIMRKIEEAS